jgi:hypothetical protein
MVAPEVGFEPTTNRLTADRSTTELLRNGVGVNTSHRRWGFKQKDFDKVFAFAKFAGSVNIEE